MYRVSLSFDLRQVSCIRICIVLVLSLFSVSVVRVCKAQETEASAAMSKRRGEIVVKVPQFEAARERILKALSLQGAELIDAKTRVNEKGRKHGWITVRLASDRLADALPVIRTAGKLAVENIITSDNTSDYEGLARRADHLSEHQKRLAGILTRERRLRGSDILYVQERLFRASVDEGLLEQKREDIARESRFCTLTIHLFEPLPTRTRDRVHLDVAGHFASAKARALAIVDQNRARAITALAYGLVFAPLWVPLLIVGLIALRLFYRFVAFPVWCHRVEILHRARIAAKGLYILLPERIRQGVTTFVTGVKPAAPVPVLETSESAKAPFMPAQE
jgi:Domain of unknown function (DUF4349)